MLNRFSFILIFVLVGCSRGPVGFKFGNDEPEESSDSAKTQGGMIVGFDQVNALVFSKHCQSCHGGKHEPLLNSFQTYKGNASAVFQAVVVEKSMPQKGSMTDEEIDLVRRWVEQGSQEVSVGMSPPATTPVVEEEIMTFKKLNKAFYAAKCASCHFTDNPDKLTDYSTYSQFKDNVGTILAAAIIYMAMPPPPSEDLSGELNTNQLTRAEKEMINKWILDGQKEE